MKVFEIYNQQFRKGKDNYNFIIKEVWYSNKTRKKFYEISKNGECDLHTSLWQTWKANTRKIRGE